MPTLFKRKSFLLVIVMVVFVTGVTCYMVFGKSNNTDVNKNLLNAVSEIEKSTYELNMVQISYDEYKQRTDKYLSKYFTSFYKTGNIIYAENKLVPLITGKEYTEKDWIGIPLQEIKKIGEPLRQSLILNKVDYNYKTSEISKVYDDNTLQLKHIFVKRTAQFNNENIPIYKQYTFKKEGKSYVLFSFRPVIMNGQKLPYGNEIVEFVQNINL